MADYVETFVVVLSAAQLADLQAGIAVEFGPNSPDDEQLLIRIEPPTRGSPVEEQPWWMPQP